MEQYFWWVFGIVAVYFFAILGSIVYSRVKETGSMMPGVEEFFLAKRSLPLPVLVLTFVGSLFSAWTVVGMPGMIHTHGVAGPLFVMGAVTLGPIVFWKLLPKIRQYAAENKVVSPIGLLRRKYNSTVLGVIGALIFVVFLSPYLSLQLVGLGKLLEVISNGEISYVVGVGSMMVVILAYVLIGGMRAVAYTDTVQAITILIAVIGGATLIIGHHWGSVGAMIAELEKVSPAHLSLPGPQDFFKPLMFMSYVMFSISLMLWPHMVTRCMMARSDKEVKSLMVGQVVFGVLSYIPVTLIGLSLVLLYPEMVSNNAGGTIFNELSTIGMAGVIMAILMLIGVLGASMSTADSLLLTIAQMITRDTVRPFVEISRPKQVLFAKMVMTIVLLLAFLVGVNPPELMIELGLYASKGAGLFIPLYLGMWWARRTVIGAVGCLVIGAIVLLVFGMNNLNPMGIHGTIWAYVIAWGFYIACGYIFEPAKEDARAETEGVNC